MKKLMIFWMICVFAKATENRNHTKFVKAFEEYERSEPPAREEQRGYYIPPNYVPVPLDRRRPRRPKSWENPAWANPCDLAKGPETSTSQNFTQEDARIVANQAKAALDEAQKFKDIFACNIQSLDVFSETSEAGPWLRKFKFMNEDVFPKDKNKINKEMSKELLSKVTHNMGRQIPTLFKALKMVAAGLYAIKEHGLRRDLTKEEVLKPYFDVTFNRVRQVICVFSKVMLLLHAGYPSLFDDEIPSLKTDRVETMFMIYRDSMLYLDFLRQVMNHWADQTQFALDHNHHFHYYTDKDHFIEVW